VIASSWKQHRYTQKYGSIVPCTRTALVSRTRRSECRQQSDEDEDHNLQSTTVERRRIANRIEPRTDRALWYTALDNGGR